jgi:pantoate kinase
MVISLARGLLARLFGSSREFNVETGLGEEVKDIQEQIKTVQKEIRDINKAIRLSREQAKKQIIQK